MNPSGADDLLQRYIDGLATEEEQAALFAQLPSNPALADRYCELVELEVMLQATLAEQAAARHAIVASQRTVLRPRSVGVTSWRSLLNTRRVGWFAASAAAIAAAVVFMFTRARGPEAPLANSPSVLLGTSAPPLAQLIRGEGCLWKDGQQRENGQSLGSGTLALTDGLARIALACGTSILLEAPATLNVVSGRQAVLLDGNIVVLTTSVKDDFELQTRQATLHHQGTEFGVSVSETGGMLVQVFEGVVTAAWKSPQATMATSRMIAGQALRLALHSEQPQPVAFREERFVRVLPELDDLAFNRLPPYNEGQVAAVNIRPKRGAIAIDGDLKDWDLSGQFTSRLRAPYGDDHYVEGALMHDAEAIYIAAHVGDPFPMQSVMEPSIEPEDRCWKGGSLQVRFATDRSLGWPLVAVHPLDRAYSLNDPGAVDPQDTNEGLVNITMWYHRPTTMPQLTVQYGMDLHGMTAPRSGFEGAFRRDADGRGYTLEYAIPWSLLKAANPPRAGDTLGMCWQLHWSNATGRLWRGHMVELCRPGMRGLSFRDATMWGQAFYE